MEAIITQSIQESTNANILIYLYAFNFHPFVSATVCTRARFLGVIGFMLHGMMESREYCAYMPHYQIQKISLNKLKRFI
jgi:hypothetical protein